MFHALESTGKHEALSDNLCLEMFFDFPSTFSRYILQPLTSYYFSQLM